jgi:ferredoxin
MFFLLKSNLSKALNLFSSVASLYVPAENGQLCSFVLYKPGIEVLLSKNTNFGPKAILLPQTEIIYRYKNHGKDSQITPEDVGLEKTIIFGLRSCDMQAIECLDDVFLTQTTQKEDQDSRYRARRESTTTIALGCTQPGVNCFCQSMAVDPSEHIKADLQLFDAEEFWEIKAHTLNGENLIQLLEKTGLVTVRDVESVQKKPLRDFSVAVDTDGLTTKLQKMFEHPIWDSLAKKCLNCGACTYVCPTCHCFDISMRCQDACQGSEIRYWDSCMFTQYSQMAGGHNPRPGKKERVRQRFLHKLEFFPERYSKFLCTGCGRCLAVCPVNLDITEVIKQIKEADIR